MRTGVEGETADELHRVSVVSGEAVHGHDRLQTEAGDDGEVPGKIGRPALDRRRAASGHAAVVLQRPHRGDEHDGVRREPTRATDDVEELLQPHVRAETGFRHDDVAELERDAIGDERVVAVRDVRKRPAVDKGGLALEGLDEVRLERVLEQDGHRTRSPQLVGGDRLAGERLADGDCAQAATQVGEVAGDGHDRHHLGGRRDVEARLARIAVRAAAEADDDVAERAVVHVEASPPGDRERVDADPVAVQKVRLEHRREKVVRGADRVDIAGEVEVQVLHRDDLRVAAAGRAALDPEHRAE